MMRISMMRIASFAGEYRRTLVAPRRPPGDVSAPATDVKTYRVRARAVTVNNYREM